MNARRTRCNADWPLAFYSRSPNNLNVHGCRHANPTGQKWPFQLVGAGGRTGAHHSEYASPGAARRL